MDPVDGTFLTSDRRVARRVVQPLRGFLSLEVAGGVVLLIATAAALAWANSPWSESYSTVWGTELRIGLGDYEISETLQYWVNDALMTIFFFVVGLEVKRELVTGELNSARRAMLPAVAALGGMVVPALIYTAFNAGGDGSSGWGIPMATDIAFAVGVLSLMGKRSPQSLKVFLLSLAIVDDIGAILVIALFYSGSLSLTWLAVAGAGLVMIVALRSLNVAWTPLYVAVGAFVWFATFQSGIHATIAGVALGLLTPARRSSLGSGSAPSGRTSSTPRVARRLKARAQAGVAPTERLEDVLHPWSSYVIVPIFALANAGVALDGEALTAAWSSPISWGIVAGLVAGKLVGITAFSWAAVRLGLSPMPDGARWSQVAGVAAVAGIGFTVSLFITELAFADPGPVAEAKVAILAASILASALGAVILRAAARPSPGTDG